MARGWESKSVESQMDDAESRRRPRETEPPSEELNRTRELESLRLTRTRVLHDLDTATNARYRIQLEAALGHLDAKIAELAGGK